MSLTDLWREPSPEDWRYVVEYGNECTGWRTAFRTQPELYPEQAEALARRKRGEGWDHARVIDLYPERPTP